MPVCGPSSMRNWPSRKSGPPIPLAESELRSKSMKSIVDRRVNLAAESPQWGPQNSARQVGLVRGRSEEHTSELQSLMSSSYADFCLKKKNNNIYPFMQQLK